MQILKLYVDRQRATFGVEPICKVLQIAPPGLRRHAAQFGDAFKRSARARHDEALQPESNRVCDSIMPVYSARKVWKQINREGLQPRAVHCQVKFRSRYEAGV